MENPLLPPEELNQTPVTSDGADRGEPNLKDQVIETLCGIYDPEIPVNIWELGLIYDIDVIDEKKVHLKMTLTSPACPVAGSLPGEVEKRIKTLNEVDDVTVELVWEPTWTKEMMSEAAQLQLGLL